VGRTTAILFDVGPPRLAAGLDPRNSILHSASWLAPGRGNVSDDPAILGPTPD
jgi:hypothetical protein